MGQIVSRLVERPPHPAIAGRLGPTLAIAARKNQNRHQLVNRCGDEPAPMRDNAASARPVSPVSLPADGWGIVARVRVLERKRPARACGAPVAND